MQTRGNRMALGRIVQALRRIAPAPSSSPSPRINIIIPGANVVREGRIYMVKVAGLLGPKDKGIRR
eukprot:12766037-Prorocentrum_lima.AAC.1